MLKLEKLDGIKQMTKPRPKKKTTNSQVLWKKTQLTGASLLTDKDLNGFDLIEVNTGFAVTKNTYLIEAIFDNYKAAEKLYRDLVSNRVELVLNR